MESPKVRRLQKLNNALQNGVIRLEIKRKKRRDRVRQTDRDIYRQTDSHVESKTERRLETRTRIEGKGLRC